MTVVLLFIFYAVILVVVLTRSGFLLRSGLPKKWLAGLFLLNSLVGCLHLMIAYYFFPKHGDVWQMFDYSVHLRHLFLYDYPGFIRDFFPDRFSIDLAGGHFGWSNNELQMLEALHFFFNFISLDNIYINTLLFCFLAMYGKTAFYQVLCIRYPGQHFFALALAFLLPGLLFWTSVIHKEGVLFCAIGILLYCMQRLLTKNGSPGKLLVGLLMLGIIFIIRKVVLITLLPALAAWALFELKMMRRKYIIPLTCAAFTALLIFLGALRPSWSFLHLLSVTQHEFFQLKGGSVLFLPSLDGSLRSFATALPYAMLNGFLMPLPGFGGNAFYVLFFLELLAAWLVIGRSLYAKGIDRDDGFMIGSLIFAAGGCLIIGYTVPFAGAIVRYRSIFFPFLLAPFLYGLKDQSLFTAINARLAFRQNNKLK